MNKQPNIDILTGRSPLYRLNEFFKNQDTELLPGGKIDLLKFSDYAGGRQCIRKDHQQHGSLIHRKQEMGFSLSAAYLRTIMNALKRYAKENNKDLPGG